MAEATDEETTTAPSRAYLKRTAPVGKSTSSSLPGLTYGVFKVRATKMLTRDNCLELATALEFQQADIDNISRDANPGFTLISKLEEMSVISEVSIDRLMDVMIGIQLIGPAEKIKEEYSKVQRGKDEEGDSPPDETLPKRDMYRYFSNEEFYSNLLEEKHIIDKFHDSRKTACERRFVRYSLKSLVKVSKCNLSSDNLNIVLLGKTGDGKSSAGNTILGRDILEVDQSGNSVTSSSCDAYCTYENRNITVVDTPGIHGNVQDKEAIIQELIRMAFLLRHGVHCFIICLSASDTRFTKDTMEMLEAVKLDDGDDFFDYCMLIYTKAETELHKCSLDEFLVKKKENKENKAFLQKINDRVVAINNSTDIPAEKDRNRAAVIEMVDQVITQNVHQGRSKIFTNKLFERADKVYQKIASVVAENECHPTLVNACIETFISSSGDLVLEEFVSKVMAILQKNCQLTTSDIQLRNGNEVIVIPRDTCESHINLIYKQIRKDIKLLYRTLEYLTAFAASVGTVQADVCVQTLSEVCGAENKNEILLGYGGVLALLIFISETARKKADQ